MDIAVPVEISDSREAAVGDMHVRRALPRAGRRTIGAWCFVDHIGPGDVPIGIGSSIGPHPHIGLQTVTWLLEGEVLHLDSLGSEQPIRPGELNLMTAGHGVAHAEEGMGALAGRAHGAQLWVAQPDRTRNDTPAFEHHAVLPSVELGTATATVLVGEFSGASSPARRDTDHVGVDLSLRTGTTVVPAALDSEHGVVVLSGAVTIDGAVVTPGHLAYLGIGRDELAITAAEPSRLLLLGGVPFEARVSMFWNFVAREHAEIDEAYDQWMSGDERFGPVASRLERIPPPRPPWRPPA